MPDGSMKFSMATKEVKGLAPNDIITLAYFSTADTMKSVKELQLYINSLGLVPIESLYDQDIRNSANPHL